MSFLRRHHVSPVALATFAVVAATYGGAVAIWTQLPGNDPGGGATTYVPAAAHAAKATSMAGMKMPGMKMPATSR